MGMVVRNEGGQVFRLGFRTNWKHDACWVWTMLSPKETYERFWWMARNIKLISRSLATQKIR